MNISITNYPFYKYSLFKKKFNGGPYIFLRRLSDAIEKHHNIYIRPSYLFPECTLYLGGKKINKKKYLLRLDGLNIDIKDKNRIKQHQIISQNIINSSGIVFISEYCKKVHSKYFNIKNKKVRIINNAVPLNTFKKNGYNLREKLGYNSSDFVLICSARWKRKHKRLDEILEFFSILKQNITSMNFKLLVLGSFPDKIVHQNNYNDVFFAGDIDFRDLPKWYRSANLFLHMAWIEPLGNSPLEAIASGIPILCVNNGGLKEIVLKTKSGIVSKADYEYDYSLIDYYNPPKPNYETLLDDFKKLLVKYNQIKNNIYLEPIDIINTSKQYIEFFNEICNKK